MPKSKYLSKKAEADGITFDSKKERDRYLVLKSQERQGIIYDLQMQVPFVIIPAQYETVETVTKSGKLKIGKRLIERKVQYVADFTYTKDRKFVVEDVKGYRNSTAYQLYSIKRKLMLYNFGIRIVEV